VSIRVRLAIGIAILLVAIFAAMGVVMARTTESTLQRQVDRAVIEQSKRLTAPNAARGSSGPNRNSSSDDDRPTDGDDDSATPSVGSAGEDEESRKTVAWFVFKEDGKLRQSEPSGYQDDPDSPPALPEPGSDAFHELVGRIVTLPSRDGSLQYRVLAQPGRIPGDMVVTAAPLKDVEAAVQQLLGRFAIIGVIGLLIAAGTSWWVIRREFRPVEGMVDTAAAIAGGDLSRRVPEGSAGTELGRLGSALNEMLGQIEEGIQHRERNEQRLRRFVADAAHELRTPLTSVRGYAELYRQGAYGSGESVDHAMMRIESEGARMARLVDDLLLLARMDQQRPIERRPLDLVSLVTEAVADFEAVAADHPVVWRPEGELLIRGDQTRLRQIVDNLLSNARAHTPPGTGIHLAVVRAGSEAQLVIADSGPGVPPAEWERVFERFWRADASRTRSTGGTGLGLAIVQSLVHAHGGTVKLDETPGGGARITIRLPIADTDPAPVAATRASAPQAKPAAQ
jgi:two-component system OmpR family sensor kinase